MLERVVYPYLGRRPDVLLHAHLGEDCAAVEFGEWVAVLTTDPVTGAAAHLGRYAVHVSCNDLATSGAEPVALLLTLLLRDGTTEEELEQIMREAGEVARSLGVEIVGGHTEVTPGIDRTIAVVTALGRARRGRVLSAAGARPGDTVLLTKSAGVEGTAILALDLADRLRGRVEEEVLVRARGFLEKISVVAEGLAAAGNGAAAMHDVTEGGVLGGAWELAEAAGAGIEIHADAVPVAPETAAICAALGVDPLRLIGSGAMLIATSSPERTAAAVRQAGVPVAEIGVVTAQERVVVRSGRRMPLAAPEADELWRVLAEVRR
ncbi:MAG: AIR synthase family protein [Armatimonadota bacterium]|nr:AIR synthase family protein [Armatimonadota bacterium]MDR7467115.1 AIR synthase family protein [Armatimonadota bacterium]MDR7493343.1 AIR synthase family protein [Armatimonadota bacterium]MDR7505409.1 AIR synthase family protein [Armatimonadota bacterium]MDR7546701.1 AIR synthase family protein [Armatimonadota bacterium]